MALLLPARVAVECAAARAAFEPAAAAAAEAFASAAPAVASALQGLVAMGKKSSVDDEFAALTGGKAKGKGGGGKGGGKAAVTQSAGLADGVDAASSKPVTPQSLLSDALVAAGTPATAGAPDRAVSLGYFQRFSLGGNAAAGLPQQQLRSAGVMQVRGVASRGCPSPREPRNRSLLLCCHPSNNSMHSNRLAIAASPALLLLVRRSRGNPWPVSQAWCSAAAPRHLLPRQRPLAAVAAGSAGGAAVERREEEALPPPPPGRLPETRS